MYWLAFSADLILSLVFFASFYTKAPNMANFRLSIASYRVLPGRLLTPAAYTVLAAELILFAAYMTGALSFWKEGVSALLLFAFTALLLVKRRKKAGEDGACSCFGTVEWLNRYPATRNGVLLSLIAAKTLVPVATRPLELGLALTLTVTGLWLAGDVFITARREKELRIQG
ncbi:MULTISPECIES: MauE/DoxX family redox-associated membrane protein [unclassified Paenibacillus]|uniref:MauE/DoxX family redox-associated membrane protein n=1 Tax=unclassified Paenibacillus TaxID=185978 RepID=UPI00020D72C1|nr:MULTISPECIES: MauE/DoxX family redox-associated membrane protein [unclassified Paenibacillus]EGL16329.1 hypothetical protein HMPREF9413_2207 [Paenibacillus sp. HGF7]EPD88900.1 hypothetical protein HMPREF1207_01851 [Paenibacillus sp. HGH0039]